MNPLRLIPSIIVALLALTGCAAPEVQQLVSDLSAPNEPAVEFYLQLSNQSFDEPVVDIDVFIDGTRVVTGELDVVNQHAWHRFDFLLSPGTHTVRIERPSTGLVVEGDVDAEATPWGIGSYQRGDSFPEETFHLDFQEDEPFFI